MVGLAIMGGRLAAKNHCRAGVPGGDLMSINAC
jgi:hypothetical protein